MKAITIEELKARISTTKAANLTHPSASLFHGRSWQFKETSNRTTFMDSGMYRQRPIPAGTPLKYIGAADGKRAGVILKFDFAEEKGRRAVGTAREPDSGMVRHIEIPLSKAWQEMESGENLLSVLFANHQPYSPDLEAYKAPKKGMTTTASHNQNLGMFS